MNKKILILLIIVMLIPITAFAQGEKTAIYNPHETVINGKVSSLKGYNIDGNNYYRLRDVAKEFKGTMCAFEVGYDREKREITLKVPFGREPKLKNIPEIPEGNRIAVPSESKLRVEIQDVKNYDLSQGKPKAYVIDDYTYFKLRDLSEFLLFKVDYDGENKQVLIGTEREF